MAINVSAQRLFPGTGMTAYTAANNLMAGLALTSGTQYFLPATTTAFTTALALPYGYSAGRVRVKVYNGGGTSPTCTKIQVVAQDGTNSVAIADWNFSTAVTLSTTSWVDVVSAPFVVDVAASGSGGGATGQLKAPTSSAVGGLTNIGITVTLGGSSPTATMDVELLGLI